MIVFLAFFICPLAEAAEAPSYASWPRDSIFYHVYVRSFADSDGDGIGDLSGLTSRLPYIQSLGVDGILLMPVFQNAHPEYGGYATTDYYHVERDYGGDAAWDKFIVAAHERKLKVILDLSITQVAETHPWFIAAKESAAAPQRAHFLWNANPLPQVKGIFGAPAWNPAGDGSYYFALYAPNVPTLNYWNNATVQDMLEVAAYWLKHGADGYRLDSAPLVLPVDPVHPAIIGQSGDAVHAFWRKFVQRMKAAKPESFAVAEIFDADPSHLSPFYHDGIDMAFDYPIYFGLAQAFSTGQCAHLASVVSASLANRPHGALSGIFLDNHDVPGTILPPSGRSADLLHGDLTRMQSAALLLFSLPGTPFIYYGDEIGLRGAPPVGSTRSEKNWSRNPMQWDSSSGRGFTTGTAWTAFSTDSANVAAQDGMPGTLLETYRGLIKIRRSSPALTHGEYQRIPSTNPAVFCFLRTAPDEKVLVVVNFSNEDAATKLNLHEAGIADAEISDRIFGWSIGQVNAANAANYSLDLPAYQGRWWRVK